MQLVLCIYLYNLLKWKLFCLFLVNCLVITVVDNLDLFLVEVDLKIWRNKWKADKNLSNNCQLKVTLISANQES